MFLHSFDGPQIASRSSSCPSAAHSARSTSAVSSPMVSLLRPTVPASSSLRTYGERLGEHGHSDLGGCTGPDGEPRGPVDTVPVLDAAADQPVGARVLEAT